jgi:hypothetical protein
MFYLNEATSVAGLDPEYLENNWLLKKKMGSNRVQDLKAIYHAYNLMINQNRIAEAVLVIKSAFPEGNRTRAMLAEWLRKAEDRLMTEVGLEVLNTHSRHIVE